MPNCGEVVAVPQNAEVSPPTKESAPVQEVLSRIQVRDPQNKPNGIYGRRMTDFDSGAKVLATVSVLAMILSGIFWSAFVQMLTTTWNLRSTASSLTTTPPVRESLTISKAAPRLEETPPATLIETPEALIAPTNLRALFVGPQVLELHWDELGGGYRYRVYAAASPGLQDAQPLSENPIQASHMIWMPDNGIQEIWVSVKGVSAQGRETNFSRPVLVQLPL